MPGHATALRRTRWAWVLGGFVVAYLTGYLGAVALRGLGWWPGARWERAVPVWVQGTVSPWLDPFFLFLPNFGTNCTLVPLVALTAFWLWRPPV